MEPVPSSVKKRYPRRGPLQQCRFAEATAFRCFRCTRIKRSKLISVYMEDWSKRLCNGCYGRLLSLYDIKSGTKTEDERAKELAGALLSMVSLDDQRQAERLYRTAEDRAKHLSPEAVRFIATAEHVASGLESEPQLEWSPAVIGLCKAVESELIGQIIAPLAGKAVGVDLTADKDDGDIGRVTAFCMDTRRKPPELGVFARFLQTVIHSKRRRETSATIRTFLRLAGNWSGANWILDPAGLHQTIVTLATSFRNRAAHIDELGSADYRRCRELVIGRQGVVWRLVLSTEHKG